MEELTTLTGSFVFHRRLRYIELALRASSIYLNLLWEMCARLGYGWYRYSGPPHDSLAVT